MSVDLAQRLRLARVEAIFQSDVVIVRSGETEKIAKHPKQRPETSIPRFFAIQSISVEDGSVVTVIVPEDRSFYDGKDKIKRTW